MPYTPPSHRSPASSASASPNVSRRSSLQSGSRPNLPRSASYLLKHRRTPSAPSSDVPSGTLTPQGTSEDLKSMVSAPHSKSVRQSPPPVTAEGGMPNGAIISPPDSASSGSDDERVPEIRGRKLETLKNLRDAVSQIPQQRTPSPQRQGEGDKESNCLEAPVNVRISFSTSALGELSTSGRKMGHMRSATEPHAIVTKGSDASLSASDEDTDEDLRKKPSMVRKKSGELVRPALRPPSRRRPSSMPGTPIFSKAVHFDSHLEHVRHFLQVDRPLAVSAGSSPVDSYDSDREYPFPQEKRPGARSPPFEWDIITSNFPQNTMLRKALPVRLEKVWLSADQKSMLGSVVVANLAFNKSVSCRFTLDYWKTTSEVMAEFSQEIKPRETPAGHDQFIFSIKLTDIANLETKTLFFCVRYAVNGQELWDNNNSSNFQVDFRKKHLPINGKNNFQGASSRTANGLPRSNRRQSVSNAPSPRPKSTGVSFDDFGDDKISLPQSVQDYLGEPEPTALRFKTKSINNLASDNITRSLSSPVGLAFANRYDFGASLSAAVQAAKDPVPKDKDGLYMKANVRGTAKSSRAPTFTPTPRTQGTQHVPGSGSSVPGLPSTSYEELVNKYCFFGSKQPSPTLKEGTMRNGRSDGSIGDDMGTGSTNSSSGSPRPAHHAGGAAHHSLHLSTDAASSYFLPGTTYVPSPAASPLKNMSQMSDGSNASTPKAASGYAPYAGTSSNEVTYNHSSQQVLAQRFPWGGEAHAATAIRG